MKEIALELVLKFLGSLLVGAALMFWLTTKVDGAQVVVFAVGLTALLVGLNKKVK